MENSNMAPRCVVTGRMLCSFVQMKAGRKGVFAHSMEDCLYFVSLSATRENNFFFFFLHWNIDVWKRTYDFCWDQSQPALTFVLWSDALQGRTGVLWMSSLLQTTRRDSYWRNADCVSYLKWSCVLGCMMQVPNQVKLAISKWLKIFTATRMKRPLFCVKNVLCFWFSADVHTIIFLAQLPSSESADLVWDEEAYFLNPFLVCLIDVFCVSFRGAAALLSLHLQLNCVWQFFSVVRSCTQRSAPFDVNCLSKGLAKLSEGSATELSQILQCSEARTTGLNISKNSAQKKVKTIIKKILLKNKNK